MLRVCRYLCLSVGLLAACHADPGYGGQSSAEWIEALGDSSASMRTRAADALGRILRRQPHSTEVVRALIVALDDPSDEVRSAASVALTAEGLRAKDAIPGLTQALRDSAHPRTRREAAAVLGSIGSRVGERAVPALAAALRDPDAAVRARSAEALGKLGPVSAPSIPELVALAHETESDLRRKALEALANIAAQDPRSRAAFFAALGDSSPAVRVIGVYSLGRVPGGDTAVVHALARALTDDPAPSVRAAAAVALSLLGAAASPALPALERARADPDATVRAEVVRTIASLRGTAVQRMPEPTARERCASGSPRPTDRC